MRDQDSLRDPDRSPVAYCWSNVSLPLLRHEEEGEIEEHWIHAKLKVDAVSTHK